MQSPSKKPIRTIVDEISIRDILCGTARMVYSKIKDGVEAREIETELLKTNVIVTSSMVWEGFIKKSYEKRITTGFPISAWIEGLVYSTANFKKNLDLHSHNIFSYWDRNSPHIHEVTIRAAVERAHKRQQEAEEKREYQRDIRREPPISNHNLIETFEW